MTDLVTFGETMLRLAPPPGDRLETAHRLDASAGGAESNVAVAASQLGLDAVWLSKLPETPLGRRVVRELRGHGVRTGVAWVDDGRVGTYYYERGETPRGNSVHYDRGRSVASTASPDDLPLDVVQQATAFHTTGITPGLSETLAETVPALVEVASAADTTTTFDVNYRESLWSPSEARAVFERILPMVDVLFVAARDAERIFQVDGTPVEAAHAIATEYEPRTLVLTRGERGALALHDGEVFEQPAFETDTYDAVGSGDAFVGGYLARRLDGGDVAEALGWGAATAALARTMDGDAAVVTPGEARAVRRGDHESISR